MACTEIQSLVRPEGLDEVGANFRDSSLNMRYVESLLKFSIQLLPHFIDVASECLVPEPHRLLDRRYFLKHFFKVLKHLLELLEFLWALSLLHFACLASL